MGPPDPADKTSFDRLHVEVRRWIHARGWTGLRAVQERAVAPLLARERDVLLAAATAAGKTEAAFLPIATRILEAPAESVQALCLSPLKALVNDQHRRLDELAGGLGIAVHRWHGDVGPGARRAVLEEPRGILLITPESLEALFVLRGGELARMLAGVEYLVVDELHAFPGGPRGRHLQSLLHRVEDLVGRRVPRVGLSATLGDLDASARYLRPEDPARVEVIDAGPGGDEVRAQVRADAGEDAAARQARHLFDTLRGADNLVFANARAEVEALVARLAELSEERRVPNEFVAHHGSLARELREHAEERLREGTLPLTVVCTSTLELGLDVGDVESVAQVGAPPSVAALRQRLGRSGRRGGPAVLRVYVREPELAEGSPPQDRLREELVQAVASVELVFDRWCEPPEEGGLHLSTLVQQVLSVVAQRHGARADALFDLLCRRGPFRDVDASLFADVLRSLGDRDVLVQDADGALLLGLAGERIVEHYSFYAAFATNEEYDVVGEGGALGTMPVAGPVAAGESVVFAGRRWRVAAIDDRAKRIELVPGGGGAPPLFAGTGAPVHGVVRRRMRTVLASAEDPGFLDRGARALLAEARASFRELELDRRAVVPHGAELVVLPWCGDRALRTLARGLGAIGVEASASGLALTVRGTDEEGLWRALGDLEHDGPLDAVALARAAGGRAREKHDGLLDGDLLARAVAARDLDRDGAHAAVERLIAGR